jgi:opacity protein-like surface antigen
MTGPRHVVAATIAAAILLALPGAAHAQAKPRKSAAPAAKAVAAPAPDAARPAANVVAPPAAAPFDEVGPWRVGLALGYEKDSDAELAGPRVHLELERDLVPLGARGGLSLVAGAAWFHGTSSKSTPIPLTTNSVTVDTTADVFELVPAFRASFALVPRLRVFAEIGVGGGWTKGSVETSSTAAPGVSATATSDSFLGVLRLSAGGTFAVNERLRVGVELPTLIRRYGETQSQTLSFSAMAAYAF